MGNPLVSVKSIDVSPSLYLESVGQVFTIFGAPTQDSGNLSYGIQTEDHRYFVKTADPNTQTSLDWDSRVDLLRNAIQVAGDCSHHSLPSLRNVIESPEGPMLVYDWVEGELLGGRGRADPQSAHQRFRSLPVGEILTVLDSVFELHLELEKVGRIAVDFYDRCMIYDFSSRTIRIVDLDNYAKGPFQNSMGRMFGSSRFMAPEEFEYGRWINEQTTVFTMGRTALVFLSDNSLDRDRFRGGGELYEVVAHACYSSPQDRYHSMLEFWDDWQQARR